MTEDHNEIYTCHCHPTSLTIAAPANANATRPNLTKLNVSHNNISSLQPLRSLSTLRHLDVSFNRIDPLPLDTFARMRNLATLNLCDSGLTADSIEHGLFAGPASTLQALDISYNRLRTLDWSVLTVLGQLHTLHVDGNQLTDLRGLAFGGGFAQRLQRIGIADNPFNCTYLASVVEHLGAQRLFVPDAVAVFDTTNVHGMACVKVSDGAAGGTANNGTVAVSSERLIAGHMDHPPEHALQLLTDRLDQTLRLLMGNVSAAESAAAVTQTTLPTSSSTTSATPTATRLIETERPAVTGQTAAGQVIQPSWQQKFMHSIQAHLDEIREQLANMQQQNVAHKLQDSEKLPLTVRQDDRSENRRMASELADMAQANHIQVTQTGIYN